MANKVFLIGSDTYYYMAIADSILKYGEMRDITAIPSFPVKSPQNGIVFIHVILSFIGIGSKARILIIVVFNYLIYLSGIYPLYKIARWSGHEGGLPLASLLSVYLGAWHIYRINLLAINDGIFNSLILWLVYVVIKFIREMDILKSFSLTMNILMNLFIIYLLVIVSVLFRLNSALIIGSAVISTIFVRKFKSSVLLLVGCLFLVVLFIFIYLFVEIWRMENLYQDYILSLFRPIDIDSIK
ncbi:uncharacterized protein METZ01_LOCUS442862, partial [marine metagenome]